MYKTLQGIFTKSTDDRLISEPSNRMRFLRVEPLRRHQQKHWNWATAMPIGSEKMRKKKATSKFRSVKIFLQGLVRVKKKRGVGRKTQQHG